MPYENGWTGYAGAKLEELWSLIGHHDLVYRGTPDPLNFTGGLKGEHDLSGDVFSHFGNGYYYTKRYDIACLTAGFGGVVTVHRYVWQKVTQLELVVRELRNADWEEVVRGNIGSESGELALKTVDIEADFVIGSLVEDVWDVRCGGTPVETGVWVGSAKSAKAREFMMEGLEAVIFLDLRPGEMKRR